MKTSEMELENHAKRAAQLETEVKGKVFNCFFLTIKIINNKWIVGLAVAHPRVDFLKSLISGGVI